ncbi:hypothetical protein QD712_29340 [Streptomyces acidiscabies]|uniref:hypothetical protein n=1 Tax=Streptomyces acidiscabies TaxID=42234 RepID=UPI0030D3A561
MGKRLDVGQSDWRTPAKHSVLNNLIGEEVGASPHLPKAPRRLVWFDLTAGDAAAGQNGEYWNRSCSPGILAYQATRSELPVEIYLYEINPETFIRLVANLGHQLPKLGYSPDGDNCWRSPRAVLYAINGDGRDASIRHLRPGDAVFAINDPNAVTGWAMRSKFSHEVIGRGVRLYRSLTTMGCNATGLKRGKKARPTRIECFDRLAAVQGTLASSRDLCLAAANDDAQWSYLIETSDKWRGRTESNVRRAFKKQGHEVTITWYRVNSPQFQDELFRHFLTKAELKGIRGKEQDWLAATMEQRLQMINAFEEAPPPPPPAEQMTFWEDED